MFCEKGVRAPATLLKKETLAQVFSCEFCEISKKTFFYRTPLLLWLLLLLERWLLFAKSY